MVNYDLPWNPNRLEQRFGHIHRIGQRKSVTCGTSSRSRRARVRFFSGSLRSWKRRAALGGKVFDVLGRSFDEMPLKDDVPSRPFARANTPKARAGCLKVDAHSTTSTCKGITPQCPRPLTSSIKSASPWSMKRWKRPRARSSPHLLASLCRRSPWALRWRLKTARTGRYEIKHVPATVRRRPAIEGVGDPCCRVTNGSRSIGTCARPPTYRGSVCIPAHALMASLIDQILTDDEKALHGGTVLIDPTDPAPRRACCL